MATSQNETSYTQPGYRYYVLAVLTSAYVFNIVDRQILSILQEPIKRELGLADSQLGLLTGFAFSIFYVSLGLPIARWADHGVRRNIIAMSVGLWSVMTAVCGLVHNFWQLLLARMGVGVGEAGCTPPAHSMLSDMFPPNRRATALGTYNVGVSIGILFGFLMGGWLQEFFGWRMAFFAVGMPGLLLALIIRLTVKEPPRGFASGRKQTEIAPNHSASITEVIKLLWSNRTSRHMVLAAGFWSMTAYGLMTWLPSFLIRCHGLSTGTVGTWLALIMGIGGGIGTFFGGPLADRLGRIDKRWYLWISCASAALSIPFLLAAFTAGSSTLALVCLILPCSTLMLYMACVITVAHGLVENHMRAISSAVILLVNNVIGVGLGPLLIGVVSDLFAPTAGVDSLRYALMIITTAASLLAILHFVLAARHIRREAISL
ncbi:MAG: MFS transporter [Sterolibacterium sp.]